jgi:phosphoribosyl 1,2-cyclic phosphate phosphodiesterase
VTGVSLTFLGTGTSVGVPVIGCDCDVCQSTDPKNNRTRASVIYQAGPLTLLVDSGPDLREQALRENLRCVDAVLYTHAHLDHVTGFDELRAFCWKRDSPLPLHATEECLATLKQMFGWAFSPENIHRGYIKPAPNIIDGPFFYQETRITPLPVEHAAVETIGFLFETPNARSVAYLPDVKRIPSDTMALIQDVDVLIVDSLRPSAHPTHFGLDEALAAIRASNARQAWLTHLGHENNHAILDSSLPPNVRVAWDGLRIPLADLA